MKKTVDLIDVSGGVYWVVYPVAGCAANCTFSYVEDPNISGYELGKNCAKGAIHSMNPAFGLVGKVVTNPVGRYIGGYAYGRISPKVVDYFAPSEKRYTCSADQFMGGYDE